MAFLTCKCTCSVQELSEGLLACGVRQRCQEHDGSLRSKSWHGPGVILIRLQPGGFKQCPAARLGFVALSPRVRTGDDMNTSSSGSLFSCL